MSYLDHNYHREREEHCRSMAELASDPDVRRRHQELAELHAIRASLFPKSDKASSQVAAD
jgi:hypothetical protein